jgi:hypothetical protein
MFGTNGWDEKFNYDLDIFMSLCFKYQNKYLDQQYLPRIIFNFDLNSYRDSGYYALSYGILDSIEKRYYIDSNDKIPAIIVSIFRDQADFTGALRLLDFGINNLEYIKNNMQEQSFGRFKEVILSIPQDKINEILITPNKKVNSISQERTFAETTKNIETDYFLHHYFQNDSIHFYFNDPYSNNKELEDVLVVRNAYEILEFGDQMNTNYYVIFDTDSSFYYIKRFEKKTSKKFIVPNMKNRGPCMNNIFLLDHELLIFNFYMNYPFRKIAIFAKSDLLIENFQDVEKEFINHLLNDESKKANEATKGSIGSNNSFFIVILIIISIIEFLLIFYLVIRMRKAKENTIMKKLTGFKKYNNHPQSLLVSESQVTSFE